MNTKQITGIAMMAVVFGLILSPTLSSNQADASLFEGDKFFVSGALTGPSGDKPFGGDSVGYYQTQVKEDYTRFYINMDQKPSEGTIYEGWLVDVDTGVKLSIGKFDERQQRGFLQIVEDPTMYELLVITEEPRFDTDPAPHTPVAGVPISIPRL